MSLLDVWTGGPGAGSREHVNDISEGRLSGTRKRSPALRSLTPADSGRHASEKTSAPRRRPRRLRPPPFLSLLRPLPDCSLHNYAAVNSGMQCDHFFCMDAHFSLNAATSLHYTDGYRLMRLLMALLSN